MNSQASLPNLGCPQQVVKIIKISATTSQCNQKSTCFLWEEISLHHQGHHLDVFTTPWRQPIIFQVYSVIFQNVVILFRIKRKKSKMHILTKLQHPNGYKISLKKLNLKVFENRFCSACQFPQYTIRTFSPPKYSTCPNIIMIQESNQILVISSGY